MNHRRAMSLLEVTIVILILGLLSAVAAPRFSATLHSMELQAATQQLVAHLRYARQVAMNQGRTTTIQFDTVAATYSSDSVDAPHLRGTKLFVDLGTEFDGALSLTADFDSSTALSFNFEGVPYVGDTPMVLGQILLSSGDAQHEIEITPGTGQIQSGRVASVDNLFAGVLAVASKVVVAAR